jgi:hypothetical protein
MKAATIQTALLTLAGIALFWLLYESYVGKTLVAVVLGGLLLGGLVATAVAWAIGANRPGLTSWLLRGWSVTVNALGLGAATLSVYLVAEIGDHIGGANNVATRELASGLGVICGVLLKLGYDLLGNIRYSNFAKFMIGAKYGKNFNLNNAPTPRSARFTAGREAIYFGGGRIIFPRAWQLPSQDPVPSSADLASLPCNRWKRAAVRTRLLVLQMARNANAADVTAEPDAQALAAFSDAVGKVLPLLGLGGDTELQTSLSQLKGTSAAADQATAIAALKQTVTWLHRSLEPADTKTKTRQRRARAAGPDAVGTS